MSVKPSVSVSTSAVVRLCPCVTVRAVVSLECQCTRYVPQCSVSVDPSLPGPPVSPECLFEPGLVRVAPLADIPDQIPFLSVQLLAALPEPLVVLGDGPLHRLELLLQLATAALVG